jgi:AcrR family transcriptional regulator
MPPKVKIQKSDIIQTALALVREQGADAINARAIAAALGCSTQPVFSNFATMQQLQEATLASAYEIYLDFLKAEAETGKYPRYKSFGMAYILFAQEEKALFRLLFMRDRRGEVRSLTPDFLASVQILMDANGISRESAERMHLEMWACVHGIATMLATSFLSLDQGLISDMLTDVYQGLRSKYTREEV